MVASHGWASSLTLMLFGGAIALLGAFWLSNFVRRTRCCRCASS